MPELGKKFECAKCGTKFYDLGKSEAICPKCGTDQAGLEPEPRPHTVSAARRRKPPRAVESEELAGEPAEALDEELLDEEEAEAPIGVEETIETEILDEDLSDEEE